MSKYAIGIDAGGTHSTAVVRRDGAEEFRLEGGAMNGNAVPWTQVEDHLCELLDKIKAAGYRETECQGIGIGVAGISNPMTKAVIEKCIRSQGFRCPLNVFSDGEAALWGAVPNGSGILLVAGTGSICYGRKADGTIVRCGGYGHLIDDKGSAYDVGIQMLQEVVQAYDGRRLPTKLTSAVMAAWGAASIEELVGKVYAQDTGKKEIAGLALLMKNEELLSSGCLEQIQKNCISAWMELTKNVLEKIGGQAKMVFSGSLLTKNKELASRFTKELSALPGIAVTEPVMDAANGAAMWQKINIQNTACTRSHAQYQKTGKHRDSMGTFFVNG